MAESSESMLAAGEQAPSLTLKTQAGEPVSWEGLMAAGPVLLAFFKASCPVCQLTFPFLDRAKAGGIRVVGISQDDARTTADFGARYCPSLELVIDPFPYHTSNAFRISYVPSMFQVEPGGVVSHAWDGFSKAEMRKLGERAGVAVILDTDRVPVFKPG